MEDFWLGQKCLAFQKELIISFYLLLPELFIETCDYAFIFYFSLFPARATFSVDFSIPTCLPIFLPIPLFPFSESSPLSYLLQFFMCWSGREGRWHKPKAGIYPIPPPIALSDSQSGGAFLAGTIVGIWPAWRPLPILEAGLRRILISV